jgi:shikimate dehydrogenase
VANDPFLVGLVGDGIGASKSPALHEGEAKAQGLRYYYELVDMQDGGLKKASLAEVMDALQERYFTGVNLTYPYKQAVIPLLTELSQDAEALGAVNAVLFRDKQRIGHNTDWWGFAEGLRSGLPGVSLSSVAVLGAGGAGSAVTYALLKLGASRVALYDVEPSRAQALASRLTPRFPAARIEMAESAEALLQGVDGLVQATPVGMVGHEGKPVPESLLRPEMWVADVIYTPLETELLRVARSNGCRTLGGGAMAVHQAAKGFELFTGRPADVGRMLRHFETL